MRRRVAIVLAIAALIFAGSQARAVITAKTPLKAIVGSSSYIVLGKVDKYFADKPAMVVTITEDIKGKAPFRQLPINCKVADEKAFKDNKIEPLLKRFGPDMEVIIFLAPRDDGFVTFGFTNGTWFQLNGTLVEKDKAVFSLHSAEPYFRKTFKGTTDELRKLLVDHVKNKAQLPAVDDKTEPGFGPEYMPKKGAGGRGMGGPLFGVIPTIGIGAPLAILAILFPSVFGGVFVLFRQWLAFITLLSVNSTLVIVHWAFADMLPRGSWWSTPSALWFLLTISTCACALWAWRRQLTALSEGLLDAPAKTELGVLGFMSASCLATTGAIWWWDGQARWSDINWALIVVITLGVGAGSVYRAYVALRTPPPFGSLTLPSEGVILGVMALGQIAFVPLLVVASASVAGSAEGSQQSGELSVKAAPVVTKWTYTAPDTYLGMFASSPAIDRDAVYASFSDALKRGTLVRLDRNTGTQAWAFSGKKPSLRQMISTPCVADGKIYFGEGFHDDPDCQVFCVDAATGKEVWRFKTAGQTESSPCVANGKLFIGAGNDGIYCLNAKDGTKIWRYPPQPTARIQRFCGGMVVVGNRLYAGTGVDRNAKDDKGETGVFCFEADTGKLIWEKPAAAPYPVWSTPVVKDGLIYVASGNGDVFSDVEPPEKPGGALQCLDADSGKQIWRRDFPNGIIEAPAVDAHRIYFGCRDRHIYCLSRADGAERWKYFLDTPIIGTPVLDCDPVLERSVSVFTVTTAGKACCLNPRTGDIVWHFTPEQPTAMSTSPRLIVTRTADGYRRQLYFGCGVGGGTDPANLYDNRPVFYCLEDTIRVE